jgi:two-component system phosphate regulon sensor histidine kinase PhoR
MAGLRLLWQLNLSYLAIILACTLAVGVSTLAEFESFHHRSTERELGEKARLAEPQLVAALGRSAAETEALCKTLGAAAGVRLTVLRPGEHGEVTVVGDTEFDPEQMENHSNRQEIREALMGRTGHAERYSVTKKTWMSYVAVPIESGGQVTAIVRAAVPLTALEESLSALRWSVVWTAGAIAVLALAVALVVSRRISRPLEEMRRGAQRFAQGDFQHKLSATGSAETRELAEALNSMAEQLDERIGTITRQQRELEGVLASMTEGVLAVDSRERIIIINPAAAGMIGLEASEARGRSLLEVVRNVELQRFLAGLQTAREPTEMEIGLRDEMGGQRRVQLHGRVIHDARDREIGVLVVLLDVTRLRRLENVRRDFVANVSHELRTPITSIQGFVETLREGAVEDPAKTRQFLEIIARQADRLSGIIDDLLSLSRIEQDAEGAWIDMVRVRLADVLRGALTDCQTLAAERDIEVTLACPNDLLLKANPQLLEQAVSNLLNNAIKYSDAGRRVDLEAEQEGDEAVIRVRDQGWGIAAEHLPRIFERFYRVDKGRSRALGGTGLGLAIVKHIAQAHGGTVTVESTPGQGSIFTLHFPAVTTAAAGSDEN